MKRFNRLFLALFSLAALLFIACPTSDDPGQVLSMKITEKNDSLLTFDSVIVSVHSKDGKFSQEVFHGVLRNPEQVASMPLDPRVGNEYTVSIVGYRDGKIGVNKEVTLIGTGTQSKDLPIHIDKPETVVVVPDLPEILAPTDTSIAEGDSLRFRIGVRNPWSGPTTLTLKDAIPGAALDTAGRDPGDGYFTWRPNFDQGRTEPYAVTFVYASADRKIEKVSRVKVLNVNRPPKLTIIADQKVKETETLTFKAEATDPDLDSLTWSTSALPQGAVFASGSFNWRPVAGQAGNYSVKFKAFDGKDSDLVAVLITVGNVDVPPALEVKITAPERDTSVNFTPITLLYTVNGTLLQKKFPLKEGRNKIFIDTTVAGRTSLDTVTITLDTKAPGRPVFSTQHGSYTVKKHPTWIWTQHPTEKGMSLFLVRLNKLPAVEISTASYTPNFDLADGPHTLEIQERDEAGNWSEKAVTTLNVKATPPGTPSVKGANGSTNDPSWRWTSGGGGLGTYRIGWKTGIYFDTLQPGTASYTADLKLGDGSQTLFVSEKDSAGNWSEDGSFKILLDRTRPQIAILSPSLQGRITAHDPALTGTASDANGITGVTYTLGAKTGSALLAGAAWSLNGVVFEAGENLIQFKSTDMAGNFDTASLRIVKRPNVVFVRKDGSGDGLSWQTAYPELQQALDSGRGRISGNEIWVAAGNYTVTYKDGRSDVARGVKVIGGFSKDGLAADTAARDFQKDTTALSNLKIHGSWETPISDVVLDGLTFRDGYAVASLTYVENALVKNCSFLNYSAGKEPLNFAGSGTVTRCTFIGNTAVNHGAASVGGRKVTITDSEFRNNHGYGFAGGLGIFGDTCFVRRCTFIGNTNAEGVAKKNQIFIFDDANFILDIDDSIIEGGKSGINDGKESIFGRYVFYGPNNKLPSGPQPKRAVSVDPPK